MDDSIKCPKCGSTQLYTDKKGFSAGKAVGGAILTGGIGLLAGFHGSKKVIITCLSCGNKFKPGEGTPTNNYVDTNENFIDVNIREKLKNNGMMSAINYHKAITGSDLSTSKYYVENFARRENIIPKKEGCFIATACYGDYNAYEVVVLRNYRDNILSKNLQGRIFIRVYYFLSPTIANLIGKSESAKKIIRKYFLQRIINRL